MSVNSQTRVNPAIQKAVNMLSAQELDTQTDRRAKVTEAIAVPTSEHLAHIVGELPSRIKFGWQY